MDEKHISQPNQSGNMGMYGRPNRYNKDRLSIRSTSRIPKKNIESTNTKVRKDIISIKLARKQQAQQ